jgi:hypothetical protein
MDISQEISTYKELGVEFRLVKLTGEDEFRLEIGKTFAIAALEGASQFRDMFETEIRLVLMAGDDTHMLMALDFMRWRVDIREEFGPFPGKRVIRPKIRKDDD